MRPRLEQIAVYLVVGGAILYAFLVVMAMALVKSASDADDLMEDYYRSNRDEWDGQ